MHEFYMFLQWGNWYFLQKIAVAENEVDESDDTESTIIVLWRRNNEGKVDKTLFRAAEFWCDSVLISEIVINARCFSCHVTDTSIIIHVNSIYVHMKVSCVTPLNVPLPVKRVELQQHLPPVSFSCCTCLHGCCRSISALSAVRICGFVLQLPSAVPSLSMGAGHTPLPPFFFLHPQFSLSLAVAPRDKRRLDKATRSTSSY